MIQHGDHAYVYLNILELATVQEILVQTQIEGNIFMTST